MKLPAIVLLTLLSVVALSAGTAVSSANGDYQALFDLDSTNCIVKGGKTNWTASFDQALFRYQAYVADDGEFVVVAHEQPVFREDLYIENRFSERRKTQNKAA
jgi:hypothetical protein